ncbi:UNVERIFIED_CONTAM: Galactinol--sucrose galactosyltransferase [Sesamum calycinum]|uniref:Galactinol--sucrose galactosyltransferase n=1 Tax=Sesamum calycinum TaxID=2727403 RepID=A0AAW2MN51_9LAMI
MEDLAVDKIVNNGVGLVAPEIADRMYEGLHSHLEKVGIDGVKVDVIHLLEMLCEDYGGRVELAKAYYDALTSSVRNHFKGNGVIASMEHCNDFMFLGTEAISLGRVGDDFWCTDPSGDPGTFWLQGCHMGTVPTTACGWATSSTLIGTCSSPPTLALSSTPPHEPSPADLFTSVTQSASTTSSCSRASSSPMVPSFAATTMLCPLVTASSTTTSQRQDHVEDLEPQQGKTKFQFKALTLIYFDRIGVSHHTSIWLHQFTGVVGAFNCQGGGWSREERRNKCASEYSHVVSSVTGPDRMEAGQHSNLRRRSSFAMYLFHEKKLVLSKPSGTIDVSLEPFEFELITVAPVKVLPKSSVQFAPIGLVNMLNTGGAIQSLVYNDRANSVQIGVKGSGEMRAFASQRPVVCKVNGESVRFAYEDYMVVTQVPWPSSSGLSVIEYLF